jgi:hypothetical protein
MLPLRSVTNLMLVEPTWRPVAGKAFLSVSIRTCLQSQGAVCNEQIADVTDTVLASRGEDSVHLNAPSLFSLFVLTETI